MTPFHLLLVFLLLLPARSKGQQNYVNNKQLACNPNETVTLGFVCNAAPTCPSFLTFRSTPTYNNPVTIAYLLAANYSRIAAANNITDVDPLPDDTLLIIPTDCSCLNRTYYQHNASYALKHASETYFSVANNTYQALSTCQSMMAQSPFNFRELSPGLLLNVPLRCACPTSAQLAAGFNYLLTYLVRQGDDFNSIAATFSAAGADPLSIRAANNLSDTAFIFFFTPILVPLKSQPTSLITHTVAAPPPSPPPPTGSTSPRWPIFVGVGIGSAALLLLFSLFLIWFFRYRRHKKTSPPPLPAAEYKDTSLSPAPLLSSWSESLASSIETLSVYKFDNLEKATGSFAESNRINGSSTYRALINGDHAVVKITKTNVVSREIEALRKINHSRIIRLSGYCLHQGITYLVYEFADKGSLSEWLHSSPTTKYSNTTERRQLDWKRRLQVALDVADALNYLHNFADPPYIHKNLTSGNVLLDENMRAKITNFGLSRTLDGEDMMTRHVVGTHGYLAPEYVESGLITPKLDVFAFGVVMLELLSGREAVIDEKKDGDKLLSGSVEDVLDGDNVREKLRGFMDPLLQEEYPLEMAYEMADVARRCVAHNLNARPTVSEVFMALSKLVSSSLDWDPSHETSVSFSD